MQWKRLVVMPVVCALAMLGIGSVGPAGASTTLTWDLAHDMGQDYVGNPIADSYGNAGVWTFERTPLGGETSQSTVLTSYSTNPGCHVAFHGDATNGFPYVGYHYGGTSESCGTPTYPASSVIVHPASNGDSAAIKWTSPITGTVQVAADVTDVDAGGGDGVTYQVSDDNGSNLASGSVVNGGTSGPVYVSASVTAGQSLYLLVGPGGGYDFDSTAVSLTIAGGSHGAPVSLSTHVSQGKTTSAGTKTTLKVLLRAAKGGPALTGTVTADGFTCRALKDTTVPGKVVRAQATCTGVFAPGSHTSQVDYSGDAAYAPVSTSVTFG